MFTVIENNYMNNRLPMAAIQHYMKIKEKDDGVTLGTYIKDVDFSQHADIIMTDMIKRRETLQKNQEERKKLGLSKPADEYKSNGKELLIADSMKLSPIIPLKVRQALSVEVPQGVKRSCPFVSEPPPSISRLSRNLSKLCIDSECKDQL